MSATTASLPVETIDALTGSGCTTRHMLHRCVSCLLDAVLSLNLESVDLWHSHGRISSDMRCAYQHVWAISATRSKTYDDFMSMPESREACKLARIMIERTPSGRAYC